jgi:DNA-3-methyladenine glycosylase
MVLPRSFYERRTVEVARELVGKVLVHGERRGRIVEVEAYPPGDPAAHAYRGRTPRTEVLFGPGGLAYVYLSYGIHQCLNVSCEPEGSAGCVLIRGLDFVIGPGRLTRAMGITRAHYGRDLTQGDLRIEHGAATSCVAATRRIGIRKAAERLWRFVES